MLKLVRRARGHFVTLIEIRVHLIRVKPGRICQFTSLTRGGWQRNVPKFNTHVQDVQSFCFCSLNLLFCGVLVAVVIVLANRAVC